MVRTNLKNSATSYRGTNVGAGSPKAFAVDAA
jgi:hypothetical protein